VDGPLEVALLVVGAAVASASWQLALVRDGLIMLGLAIQLLVRA
jgi:hypothetical protein